MGKPEQRIFDRQIIKVFLGDGRYLYFTEEFPAVRLEKHCTLWTATMEELGIYECGDEGGDDDDVYDKVLDEISRLWLSLEEKRRTCGLDQDDKAMQAKLEKLFTLHTCA